MASSSSAPTRRLRSSCAPSSVSNRQPPASRTSGMGNGKSSVPTTSSRVSGPFGSSRVICPAAVTNNRQRSRSRCGSPVLTSVLAWSPKIAISAGSLFVRHAFTSASTAAFGSEKRCSLPTGRGGGAGGRDAQPPSSSSATGRMQVSRIITVTRFIASPAEPAAAESAPEATAAKAAESAVAGRARVPAAAAHAAEAVAAEAAAAIGEATAAKTATIAEAGVAPEPARAAMAAAEAATTAAPTQTMARAAAAERAPAGRAGSVTVLATARRIATGVVGGAVLVRTVVVRGPADVRRRPRLPARVVRGLRARLVGARLPVLVVLAGRRIVRAVLAGRRIVRAVRARLGIVPGIGAGARVVARRVPGRGVVHAVRAVPGVVAVVHVVRVVVVVVVDRDRAVAAVSSPVAGVRGGGTGDEAGAEGQEPVGRTVVVGRRQ